MSPFEAIMLACFGASWPISIWKTWRARSAEGKSLRFLALVLIGYASGVAHKLLFSFDAVIFLYILNALMVSADLLLSAHFRMQARRTAPFAAFDA